MFRNMQTTTNTKCTESASPRTAASVVADGIRQRVLNGTYSPHEYVREASVAKELQVSRTPVREALRELVSEGWLEAIPHHGCRVVSWTETDAREVFDIRLVLEPLAVGAACRQVSPELLSHLRRLCREMELVSERVPTEPEARNRLAELNHEFHQQLTEASGNRRLVGLLESLVRSSVIRRNFANYEMAHLRRSMAHHDEILQAIEARNAQWAESVMRTHLLAARSLHVGSSS
ncbi:GntR family transcriptional regulator [Marinobacter sp.]|uniref:GntR family transcriptional regulator n=1 Tax=Marinobacter sp. TaxID=50741 RepID=UPI003A92ABBA